MTLPCTGPLIVSAFLLGAGSTTDLASNILYFLVFGLGFGWPLFVLPLIATPMQRRFTGWSTRNYRALTMVSGVLLVLIGAVGVDYDLAPNIWTQQLIRSNQTIGRDSLSSDVRIHVNPAERDWYKMNQ